VDFSSWATSTGTSLRDALVGFKALRKVCCQRTTGCPCECKNGESTLFIGEPGLGSFGVDPGANLLACAGAGLAFLTMGCPNACKKMGTPCDVLDRPANA
jgi:hypothetical protein